MSEFMEGVIFVASSMIAGFLLSIAWKLIDIRDALRDIRDEIRKRGPQ